MSQPVVVVLAGGASSRFWPLRDKLLLPFGPRSLLERHLSILSRLGCDRMVIVTRPDAVDEVTALARELPGQIRVAVQPEATGMADAVLCARPDLEAFGEGAVYVTQAHDVVEQRLHAEVLGRWARGGIAGLIGAVRVTDYFPGGYLTLQGNRVTAVLEKPGAGNEPSDLVNLVAHVHGSWLALEQTLSYESAHGGGDDAYERALTSLTHTSHYEAHVYDGRWQGLKYPWHVLDVMDMLLGLWTRGEESPGEGYEQREDGVFMARDVRVFAGSHIVGPALVGPGCVIGHNALVRGSLVGAGSVVGFGCEVARSFLAGGVELHHNYVGDSVLDHGTSMGYGATTANYRIDGRTVPSVVAGERIDTGREKLGLVLGAETKIGVNTSTMPGVKIGAAALIGPGIRITRDVPDRECVLDEETYGRF